MKKTLHITVAGKSTGVVLVMDPDKVEYAKLVLTKIRFGELPAADSYMTLLTDAFFDVPGISVYKSEDVEIR